MASRVFRTIKSRVPWRISDLSADIGLSVACTQEYCTRHVGCQQEVRPSAEAWKRYLQRQKNEKKKTREQQIPRTASRAPVNQGKNKGAWDFARDDRFSGVCVWRYLHKVRRRRDRGQQSLLVKKKAAPK